MSTASTIKRNGMPISWRKMNGNDGVYDFTSASVVAAPITTVAIYGVVDGFGSVESQLRGEQFGAEGLEVAGSFRVFTTTKVEPGDVLGFDSDFFTCFFVKPIFKKKKVECYMALVRR